MSTVRTSAQSRARELVQVGRFADALALLLHERERMPGDALLLREIEWVRERVGQESLEKLGDLEVIPSRVAGASVEGLDAPGRYVAERVDGVRTLANILRFSTLGRVRTAQVLLSLRAGGVVEWFVGRRSGLSLAPATDPTVEAPWLVSSSQPLRVLVADGNGTQATLTRTLLRLTIPRPIEATTVGSLREALDAARTSPPSLFVADFSLSDADGCDASQRLLALLPDLHSLVVTNALDHELARSRLPTKRAVLLRRPFDKAALSRALTILSSGG
jgi:CheY-like chemotaxis protein